MLTRYSYFSNAHRIFSLDFIPTNEDILRTDVRASGITTTSLKSKRASYSVIDPGGAYTEQRKWSRVYQNIDCIIFVVPLCAYDTAMPGYHSNVGHYYLHQSTISDNVSIQNEISEALSLFDSILALHCFRNTQVILVMNKIDLFKQKLVRKPIVDYWPEFQGEDDYQTAIYFFTGKFLALQHAKDRDIHVRCTNATDTESVKRTLQGIEDLLNHIARTRNAPFSGSET